jgi:anthranilate synthase/aminodeoxychorismate synthase-like glutamine amidotransferase
LKATNLVLNVMAILLIDNFDSFTYTLRDYLLQTGMDCQVERNTLTPDKIRAEDWEGLVLSPGPGRPVEAGYLMAFLNAFHQQLPILGVCLGHQAIGEFFGAKLGWAARPMHGKLSEISCEEDVLFNGLPRQLQVVRYHSLVLTQVSAPLRVTAVTEEGEVMALVHGQLPIWGLQFHPEAVLTKYGLEMIKNWVIFCRDYKKQGLSLHACH